jgi:hypothetical protein
MRAGVPFGSSLRARLRALAAAAWTFIPIPMYTTVPNEGSTYGIMPVILNVGTGGSVESIWAPSVSWNSAAGVNGTIRYYYYANTVRWFSIVAAASTNINRTLWLTYEDVPVSLARPTVQMVGMIRRNIFFRYFGEGPDSLQAGESSYARTTALLGGRVGVNLPRQFNIGVRMVFRGDNPIHHAIFGLPATQDLYPDAPGLGGAGVFTVGPSLRFDSRSDRDYSHSGALGEITGTYNQSLTGFEHFWRLVAEGRGLVPETDWLQGAARVYLSDEWGPGQIPFYYQSTLGGEILLRGFPEDRFIDRGAWEAEVEQRVTVLQTHIFNVDTDWRVDPFFALGQVYGDWSQIVSHVRYSVGIGLRAWVHPNLLGRVDLAYGGEGIHAYIVLGYPY